LIDLIRYPFILFSRIYWVRLSSTCFCRGRFRQLYLILRSTI